MKIYKDKTVLVTGHTGFKGSWLCTWLTNLGAKVVGVSLDTVSEPSNFEVSDIKSIIDDHRIDVRDAAAVKQIIVDTQPDFLFHLAAQALVRPSYQNPLETLSTNAMGTANVLDALRFVEKQVVAVMITSDKAYDNVEWIWGYRETDRLGGKDPYSASKGMAELAIRTYVESFFNSEDNDVRIGIARAGNVIGGGDWATDRIVPDCMNAWSSNQVVDIRNPDATRPWQHVLEPLSGYLVLGAKLAEDAALHGEAYNFGPPGDHGHSVRELINGMSTYWDNVQWNDTSKDQVHLHEAVLLKLNCDKALFDLKWQPAMVFDETIEMTVQWYKTFNNRANDGSSMLAYTRAQIDDYTRFARERGIDWAVS